VVYRAADGTPLTGFVLWAVPGYGFGHAGSPERYWARSVSLIRMLWPTRTWGSSPDWQSRYTVIVDTFRLVATSRGVRNMVASFV